jgi:hypothetical protein
MEGVDKIVSPKPLLETTKILSKELISEGFLK